MMSFISFQPDQQVTADSVEKQLTDLMKVCNIQGEAFIYISHRAFPIRQLCPLSRTFRCRTSTRPSWPTCRAWGSRWTWATGRWAARWCAANGKWIDLDERCDADAFQTSCRIWRPGCVTGWSSRWPSRSLQPPHVSHKFLPFTALSESPTIHCCQCSVPQIMKSDFFSLLFRCSSFSLLGQDQMPAGCRTYVGLLQASVWRAGQILARAVLARHRLLLVCGWAWGNHPGHGDPRPPHLPKRWEN